MKKKRIGAFVLASCMLFSQVAWAQEPAETGIALSQAEEVSGISQEAEESETVQEMKDTQEEITENQQDITEEDANTSSGNIAEEVSNNDEITAEVMSEEPTEEKLYENMHKLIKLLCASERTWTIESDNNDVCSAEMKFGEKSSGTPAYYNHYVKLITKTTGEANVKVYNDQGEEYAFHVVVSERPEDSIVFRDANLEAELLKRYDGNKDGFISKNELADVSYLNLTYSDITDIEGVQYAENVERIYLDGNTMLENIDPLLNLNHLKEISIRRTGLPIDYKWKFVKFNIEAELVLGDNTDLITNGDFFEAGELTFEKVSGDDICKIESESYQNSIVAVGIGEEVVKISCGSNSQIINVKVKGGSPDQEVGEVSDSTLERIDENTILTSNGELWSLYPKTERLNKNVKRYAAGWIYSGDDAVEYTYQLQENGTLWSDGVKIADNIKDFDKHYVLDDGDNLIDIYNTNTTVMADVQAWTEYVEGEWEYNSETLTGEWISRQWCYALKKDGTLWKREEVGKDSGVNEFEKIAENIEALNSSGYLRIDGTYILFSGEQTIENVKIMPKPYYYTYYVGRDGHTYFTSDNWKSWVDLGEFIVVDYCFCYENYYFLTDSGDIYKSTEHGKNCKKVVDNACYIKQGSGLDVVYQDADGLWRSILTNKMGTTEQPLVLEERNCGNGNGWNYYQLKDYGIANDYNVTKNGVFILNHVKELLYLSNGVFAIRTDGTLWNITNLPEIVLDLNSGTAVPGDVNGDGEVNIQDLRLILRYVCGKEEFAASELDTADVNGDGAVDIQDLRKVLRYVCGKDETL